MTLSTLLEHVCVFAICWSSTLFSWITGLPNSVRRGWGKHNYTKCNNAELRKGKWMLLLISIEFKKESYVLELSYTWHSFALSQKLMFALQTHLSPLLTFGMAFSSHNWNTRFHPLLATLSPYTFSWKRDRLRDLKSQILHSGDGFSWTHRELQMHTSECAFILREWWKKGTDVGGYTWHRFSVYSKGQGRIFFVDTKLMSSAVLSIFICKK